VPVQRVPRRAGFVAHPQRFLPEILDELTNSNGIVSDDAEAADLTIAAVIGNGDGNRIGVYV
jgi:hypothetical protein